MLLAKAQAHARVVVTFRDQGSSPFIAAHVIEKCSHGSAGVPPIWVVQVPAWQLLFPVGEQFAESTLFEIVADIVFEEVADPGPRKSRLQFLMRRT